MQMGYKKIKKIQKASWKAQPSYTTAEPQNKRIVF